MQKQKGIMAENNEYASAYQQMILAALSAKNPEIGRASCRERV